MNNLLNTAFCRISDYINIRVTTRLYQDGNKQPDLKYQWTNNTSMHLRYVESRHSGLEYYFQDIKL